jgi:hypothetical protein
VAHRRRRRAARSAEPGPEAPGADALADDLNGRLPHAWLAPAGGQLRSTLDLVGPGLTLLTGPDAGAWTAAVATLDTPFPLTVHSLDPAAAAALEVDPDGAVLVRPDAWVVARWPGAPRSLSLGDLRLSPEPSPDTRLGPWQASTSGGSRLEPVAGSSG